MPADAPRLDTDARSYRYYRNAVERHWDPHAIDLATDRERAAALPDAAFESLRRTLALFGAGEQAVTEDLAPLAVVLDDPADQLFVASQLSDEARHADFFDRYWREVVAPAERERGVDSTDPTADRWFCPEYAELFERTADAMARLLTADTPENRAAAYAHYHLTVEGVLAQTGYYGVQRSFSGEIPELPALPGLVEGFENIRGDEGRHVGFGMAKLTALVRAGAVEPATVEETVTDLLPLVQSTVDAAMVPDAPGVDAGELATYALERHADRMDQLTDADAELPTAEELVELE